MEDDGLVLEIRDFKSIKHVRLRLSNVVVLVGPPASGKSNLFEALALYGYAVKTGIETKLGIYKSIKNVGYINEYIRMKMNTCSDLVNRVTLREPLIELRSDATISRVEASCEEDIVRIRSVLAKRGKGGHKESIVECSVSAEIKPPSPLQNNSRY